MSSHSQARPILCEPQANQRDCRLIKVFPGDDAQLDCGLGPPMVPRLPLQNVRNPPKNSDGSFKTRENPLRWKFRCRMPRHVAKVTWFGCNYRTVEAIPFQYEFRPAAYFCDCIPEGHTYLMMKTNGICRRTYRPVAGVELRYRSHTGFTPRCGSAR